MVENLSTKKRKRDGGVVLGDRKTLRVKKTKVILDKTALKVKEKKKEV